jgi:hypothetical protein
VVGAAAAVADNYGRKEDVANTEAVEETCPRQEATVTVPACVFSSVPLCERGENFAGTLHSGIVILL